MTYFLNEEQIGYYDELFDIYAVYGAIPADVICDVISFVQEKIEKKREVRKIVNLFQNIVIDRLFFVDLRQLYPLSTSHT